MKERLVNEVAISLFQPDSLLPAQFFAALKQKAQACGERRLMVAILEDAVDCFQKYLGVTDGRSRHLGAEAEKWFLSDDESWPFSFVNVCYALDLHPGFLRRGLFVWKDRQLARRQYRSSYSGSVGMLAQREVRHPAHVRPFHLVSGT